MRRQRQDCWIALRELRRDREGHRRDWRRLKAPAGPATLLRQALVAKVQSVFNDRAQGEAPVVRSDSALFAPGSVIWRVHGDVTTMMIGGVAALLFQMLHPAALAGVLEHSNFRDDMLGRLRRTARFIALTTYGEADAARVAIARVRAIHERVNGVLPDGTSYQASDPRLLAWVHVVEASCFLHAWIRYGQPAMSKADQDLYFAEAARIARALGADPVPETAAQAHALQESYRPQLQAGPDTRAVRHLILHPDLTTLADAPVQALVIQAAIDLLPDWARALHGVERSRMSAPLRYGATTAIAATLRWAFDRV
jgi:uncharacterized protein (DUF2236 family)